MVDNLEKILPLLKWESEDDFYYLQLIQRKKDNPHIGSNSNIIKNYFVTSEEYLQSIYGEVKGLCTLFNARASLRLNKRSFEKVAFKTLVNVANSMANKDYKSVKASHARACGLGHNDKNKTWLVDVDAEEVKFLEQIIESITDSAPKGDKIVATLGSRSGVHLITIPFHIDEFTNFFAGELVEYKVTPFKIDIHKDNPTTLFMP